MAAEKDPLTQVHEKLWAILEADSDFTAIVAPDLRIKLVDDADGTPARENAFRDARQPEGEVQVAIVPGGGHDAMYNTTDGTKVTERFQVLVRSGNERLCWAQGDVYQGLNPVTWAILRAFMDWETHLKPLSWNGNAGFVHHCSVMGRSIEMGSPRMKDQKSPARDDGWNLAWQGDVEMHFPSTGDTGLLNT